MPGRATNRPALGRRHDLSWVENVQWIQRRFQRAHRVQRLGPELVLEIFLSALPDTVFAGAGAAHLLRALDQAMHEVLAARHLIRVRGVAEYGTMEISVADMTDDRRQQVETLQILFGLSDAVGEPR